MSHKQKVRDSNGYRKLFFFRENAANLFDGFAGFFMVGAAGGHADDNVAVLYDARKIKITFCFITTDIYGDPHAFACTVDV